MHPLIRRSTVWAMLCVAGHLAGCSGYMSYRQGQSDLQDGRYEAGVEKLKKAVDSDPRNPEYRQAYYSQREAAVNALFRQVEEALDTGRFDDAEVLVQRALVVDPANTRALAGKNRVAALRRQWAAIEEALELARAGDTDGALARLQWVLAENPKHARAGQLQRQLHRQHADRTGRELAIYPRLKAAFRKPISLSLSNASLQQFFETLKQTSGLNYVLDRDIRTDLRVTLSVNAKPVEDVLRLILATNQLERRVLDEDTLLIYPNTAAKNADYREMVVRAFYLSNADPNKVASLLRTIAKAKDVVVDEKLNMLVVRDSAEVVRLAEKLISTQDVAEPEVMLELEVLEVSVNRLIELGVSWPSSVSASVIGAKGAGQLTMDEVRHGGEGLIRLNIPNPAMAAQLRGQKGDAQLLANPRVRVRNKQTAKILIGERLPVFTSIATANVGTSESVNYLDVGLKLEIEPTVSLDDEVSMKLGLEVSNVLETITRTSGTQAYRLGTRNTSTSLRVRDGETNVLAGLIEKDERRSKTGLPWLSELPVMGRLFGAAQDSDARTEIVLLVTPRIIRNVEVPGLGLQEFLSGTDAAVGAAPIQLGSPVGASKTPLPPVQRLPGDKPLPAPPGVDVGRSVGSQAPAQPQLPAPTLNGTPAAGSVEGSVRPSSAPRAPVASPAATPVSPSR